LDANWMFWDRSHTWLISNSTYVTNQTGTWPSHAWPSQPIFFEMLVKEKICNLRQLNEANYMSHSFQKTYENIQNCSPECFSALFKFSFTIIL